MWGGPLIGVVLCALLARLSIADGKTEVPLRVTSVRLRLTRSAGGMLRARASYALHSRDKRFGGLSGIIVRGERLWLVSDRGYWFSAFLRHTKTGQLTRIHRWRKGPLLSPRGQALRNELSDSESLVAHRGGFLVGFERVHRVLHYRPALSSRPRRFATPQMLSAAPANGGLEAMAALSDGRLLMVAEDFPQGASFRHAWIVTADGSVSPLRYATSNGFQPTDLAQLPSGDLLALERRFSWTAGFAARLMRLDRRELKARRTIHPKLVLRLSSPLEIDNFEGLAVDRGPKRRTFVYVVSDDNFNPLQRSLLHQFEWLETSQPQVRPSRPQAR